jgi:shikimate kinase
MTRSYHHLYLTGYRGSGKTSVGKLLGEKLAMPVVDLDDRIEAAADMSIRDIFDREGETGFRARESVALRVVGGELPSVVSLGGGAILSEENRSMISSTGFCIWLKVDADTVLARLDRDAETAARRPALTKLPPREEIASMLAFREPIYSAVANVAIDVTGKQISKIADEVIAALPINFHRS